MVDRICRRTGGVKVVLLESREPGVGAFTNTVLLLAFM